MNILLLPRELFGEISNALHFKDVIQLGKSNKQSLSNLNKTDFGYKAICVMCVNDVFDERNGYVKKPYVIGHFTQFQISNLNDIKYLPHSLTHLQFSPSFNESVDNLAFQLQHHSSLTHLTFGSYFNQSVDNIKFPQSLTHLTFGFDFNQPIDNIKLSTSLTHLIFGHYFNRFIGNLKLPQSLRYLEFGSHFNQRIDNTTLPPYCHVLHSKNY